MPGQKRRINELTAVEIDPIVQSLVPFVAGLDRDDESTAGVVEAIESLFSKLKRGSRAPSIATVLDLQELRIYPYGLDFKEDAAKGLARQRGAEEVDNNFLTLANTKALFRLVRKHMSTASLAGSRMLIDVIFLRLASVLSTDQDSLSIVSDWTALNTSLDSRHSLQGVIDYLIAKRPSKYSGLVLSDPVGALNRPDLVHTGSSNIYEARTSSELQSGLTQAVMASAASCRETHKECARGAVTCGDRWIFFAYQAPKGGDYAKYARTEVLDIGKDAENLDLILGILVDWIENSEVFGPQKYFYII
ncbi:hypothetical protein BD309DRAFT_654178 [Dichomitus squalens]|uniref:Uncharacterized protein n=1 Tax=Dichomitus squalens TaxID=114155 RepID=A0A4V2K4X9_9APHY|nr:hypothetical protein BD311DRAFT_660450 [Dichomitus squalens]TBU46143.1 hypothetical protein BD309DRAFT_654178 [Dichomitus squalens]